MALFVNVKDVSIRELMELANSRDFVLSHTPFGRFGIRAYLKRTGKMEWKGVKGEEFWKVAKRHGRLEEGIKMAREISKRHAGQTGVAMVKMPDGSISIMPYKSAMQMVERGKITVDNVIYTASSYYGLLTKPEARELIEAAKLQPVVY